MKIYTHIKKILSDTLSPVSVYLSLRDHYEKPLLLESADYNSRQGHYSYICFNPFAEIVVQQGVMSKVIGRQVETILLGERQACLKEISAFSKLFHFDDQAYDFCYAGLFGYTGYSAIPYFEDIEFHTQSEFDLPDIYYGFYSLMLVFDHQHDATYLISHAFNQQDGIDQIKRLEKNIQTMKITNFTFAPVGNMQVNCTDDEFCEAVEKAKQHCKAGDVFQLVLSKRYAQKFSGDEFNVYRALRNLNPSPYMFYFDLGNFKLFGSSPEAQIKVSAGTAEIHPIAGTYKRTGSDTDDLIQANKLFHDPKEKSEHMMLVDLARNDLSKYCREVHVKKLAEIQFYSHVIHLVSMVQGKLKDATEIVEILTGTFPAGTLSGAPKYRAMQLIDKIEKSSRQFYGGCIGFITHQGYTNHAILIRSFLSKDFTLTFQAGAGVVIHSIPEHENAEAENKCGALKAAIQQAATFNQIQKSKEYEIVGA
ncbi:MAG: chorismate-binding protein [Crocinitomicaceae bacterium]|nr:chorismate-binding protein [Crocinitomicaceae bacterium]